MTTLYATTMATPVAPLTLMVDGDDLVAAGFTADAAALQARLGPARRRADMRLSPELGPVTKALDAYFDGDLAALDGLGVVQDGTENQQRVWSALRDIPPGAPVSYTELARRVGNTRAVRAAGSACGRNHVAPIVPCHRVVRSDGTLGGYGYGLPVKRWLLDHEHHHAP